jgi:hypothetical protein
VNLDPTEGEPGWAEHLGGVRGDRGR